MSGLECSELMLSELENNFTLGAEYYRRDYVETSHRNETCNNVQTLGHISCLITDGDHGVTEYLDNGIIYLLSECITKGFIDTTKARYISPEKHNTLHKSALDAGDVLVIKTGNIGKSAVVPDDIPESNISVHIGKIKLKEGYNPYFVSAFLNSKYGYSQIERRSMKTTRPEIKLVELRDILIPKLTDEFDSLIEAITREAITIREEATDAYATAQNILNDAIHFTASSFSTQNTTTKSFSDVFSSGRLDSEYFMPKYDNLFSLLHTLSTKKLGEIVSITKSIEPGSEYYRDEGIPFIRVSDISPMGITEPVIKIPRDTVPNMEKLFPKKDTILLSKDGSIGIAYKIEQDTESVTSGALLHLHINDSEVMPDYLTLVLNSEAVKMQAERDCSGAVIQHWRPEDISRVVIPVIDRETQNIIANHVQQSFSLRRKSERLINLAVKSVELAIEENETSAINYIKEHLNQ